MHPLVRPWLALALVACGPSAEQLAAQTDVEAQGFDDVPEGTTRVWTLRDGADASMAFEANGLFGVPANGVWARFGVQVAERTPDPTTWVVRVTVDMDSVRTGVDRLDEHIRTADYLHVGEHPEATFTSGRIVATDDGLDVDGKLTVRGTTRTVAFPATLERAGGTMRTTAEVAFSRWDFGLYADDVEEPGGDGAADEVRFSYDVVLDPQDLDVPAGEDAD